MFLSGKALRNEQVIYCGRSKALWILIEGVYSGCKDIKCSYMQIDILKTYTLQRCTHARMVSFSAEEIICQYCLFPPHGPPFTLSSDPLSCSHSQQTNNPKCTFFFVDFKSLKCVLSTLQKLFSFLEKSSSTVHQ